MPHATNVHLKKYFFITALALVVIGGLWFYYTQSIFPEDFSFSAKKPTYKIGFLTYTAIDAQVASGFKTELNRVALENNFRVIYVGSPVPFSDETMKRTAQTIMNTHPDLIVTSEAGIPYIRALDNDVPVISKLSAAESDLPITAASDSHTDNVVFVATGGDIIAGDRLFLLHELLPKAQVIFLPHGSQSAPGSNPTALKIIRDTASRLGLTLLEKEFSTRQELNTYMLNIKPGSIDAIYRFADNFIAQNYDVIYSVARQPNLNVPVIGHSTKSLNDGGVLSYGFNPTNLGKEAAGVAYKILVKNVPPNSIPTERSYHFDLGINLPVAQKLGISVPQSLLNQATIIVQ